MMSSIDFIDEAGREWAHASRYRALEDENAALRKSLAAYVVELRRADETIGALRKRVEELEGKIAEMLSDKDDYWSLAKCSNCGVLLNCNGSQREHESVWKARAEKAERERDDWRAAATTHVETIGILSDQKMQLQADLDAALDFVRLPHASPGVFFGASHARVVALLAERGARNGK